MRDPDAANRTTDAPPAEAALRARLDRLVARAGRALLWERAWPILWRGLGVVLAFLAASWLGLWLDAPPPLRIAGLAVFALALIAALAPLLRLRRPSREAALGRLDRDAGLRHGPARALEDTLALGSDDPGTRALWALHRRRAAEAARRLRVALPRPAMTRRDPYALRAAGLLAAVAAAFVAGPEAWDRLRASVDWRGAAPGAGPAFRIDGWIDPPLYTRLAPLIVTLSEGEQRLRAPVRSTLVVRLAGRTDATVTPGKGLAPQPGPPGKPDLREERFALTGGPAELTVAAGFGATRRLVIDTIPDVAPQIAFAGTPEVNVRGTFEIVYRAKDDYGFASGEALVEAPGGPRSLVPAPKIALALPADAQGEADTRSPVDLVDHPWAGAPVRLTLVAKDEAGQEGRSATLDFTLPQRPFVKPLARSLAEGRRRLVLDPDGSRRWVQTALDALLIAPDRFTPQWGVFLGLRDASARLRAARNDADLTEVADYLWQMALQIEEGDLSDAERALRAAQDQLREAIDRGAPDDEIKKFADALRQAMDRFLREFAERMQRDPQAQDGQPQQQAERVITRDDLDRMLNQMQEAMRRGDMAEAQRLLDQMRNILENLQAARPNGRMSDPMAREMNRSMQDMENMAREQQGLRDETFRQGQERRFGEGDRRQQGQGQRQQGQRGPRQNGQQGQGQQPGQQGQQGQGQQGEGQQGQGQQGSGGLGQRQQALRERLEQLQRRMRDMGMQGEQGLADAEGAMREAESALGQGRDGAAVDAQGRALEGLQRGTQGMAQQMQQMMGQGEGSEPGDQQQAGDGTPNAQGRASARDNDPLGRPTRGRDFSDGRVRVPTADESGVQRAQRILEELRRKLSDPSRPREELDYFERLLRRN